SDNPPGSSMPDTALGGPVHADFLSMHSSSTNPRSEWQTLTTTRRRHVLTRQDDQDASNSGWMNESEKNPKTNTMSNSASHTKTDTNLAPDFEKDSDSSSIVDAPSSSDDESSDDEFGSADNPKMSPQNRAELEEAIFGNKLNTTAKYKKEWEIAKAKEDRDVQLNRASKYAWDTAAGAANQVTSFGVAGVTATLAGNPWLFPVVAMLTSDLIGDRLAQVIRKSTIVATGTKAHFENHRRLARAIGDLIESSAGRAPKRKFLVEVTDPESGNKEKIKMTAGEAMKHAGCCTGLSAWGQNLLVRSLPFIWFSTIYGPLDYYLNYRCAEFFFPNGTAHHQPNFTLPSECPNADAVDPVALRWGMILIGGMMAGALTNMTGQLLGSLLPHEERTNYSPDTCRKEVIFKESALIDIKAYLDWLDPEEDTEEVMKAETLKRLYEKELRVARKKSSYWTTFQGELDLATQKHRDGTMISPEFGGKRLELTMSMLGKFLTLLTYAYFASSFNVRTSKEEEDKIIGLIMIPLSLIFIGGYALRDDARMVGQVPYGFAKGAVRACKGKPADRNNDGIDVNESTSTTVQMPKVVTDPDGESNHQLAEVPSSHHSPRGRSERVASVSETPAHTSPKQKVMTGDILVQEESGESDGDSSESSAYV
ncbi:MAG: hypothetical protein ACKOA0_11425, partial [Burkholderiaceae bacterium]